VADLGDLNIQVSERVGANDAKGTVKESSEPLRAVGVIGVDVGPVADQWPRALGHIHHVFSDGG
jgi:hypothetical protein